MTGAMKKDPETGYVTYDKEQCASCYMCVMSCPFGILKPDSIHFREIMKCNMCVHRSPDGKTANPMCVDVVIGSSAAGVNGIRELRKYDKDAEIVLISKDKDIYSRCILHEYLAGKRSLERLRFVEKDFETLYKVNWKKGVEAVGLDRAAKEVLLDDGSRESYDKLLIATGSHTFFPPIKNMLGSPNMIGFRNIKDQKEHCCPGLRPGRHRLRHRLPGTWRQGRPLRLRRLAPQQTARPRSRQSLHRRLQRPRR